MSDKKQTKSKPRPRTYARNRAFSRRGNEIMFESDGAYLLKLVLVFLLGSFWLRFSQSLSFGELNLEALPVGLFIGLFFIYKFEQFQQNRKIWYAIILLTAVATMFSPTGIVI